MSLGQRIKVDSKEKVKRSPALGLCCWARQCGHYLSFWDSGDVKFNDGSVCAQPFISMELSPLNKSMEPLPESVLQHMNRGAGVRTPRFLLCPDDGMTLGDGCRSQDPRSLDIKPCIEQHHPWNTGLHFNLYLKAAIGSMRS